MTSDGRLREVRHRRTKRLVFAILVFVVVLLPWIAGLWAAGIEACLLIGLSDDLSAGLGLSVGLALGVGLMYFLRHLDERGWGP